MANLNKIATDLAVWLAQTAQSGRREHISFQSIQEAFPQLTQEELKERCYDLESEGLIEVNDKREKIIINYDLYWEFDNRALQTDVIADSVELASCILEDETLGNVQRLHEKVGWTLRRFNPAIAKIVDFLSDKYISRENGTEYPTRSIVLFDRATYELKKFVETHSSKGEEVLGATQKANG